MVDTPPASRRITPNGRIGKFVRGALYVHRDAIGLLSDLDQQRIRLAEAAAPSVRWNVVRIETTHIGLLEYADFEESAFPRLLYSTKVEEKGEKTTRDYRRTRNPLILHKKELMARPDHPRRAEWAALTRNLERLGLFADSARIGRLEFWNRLLATANLDSEGRPK